MIDISQGLYRAVLAITATANRVLTFPDATDTVVLLNAIQTITNKLIAYTQITGTPAARVRHSANQSLTTATFTALAFDTEDYDTAALHAGGANTRMTAPVTGKYHVNASCLFDGNAVGVRTLRLRVNGTTYITHANVPVNALAYGTGLVVVCDIALTATDYVEVIAYQDSGGALNSLAVANFSPGFSMHWIGP